MIIRRFYALLFTEYLKAPPYRYWCKVTAGDLTMCDDCGGICAVFDRLIMAFFESSGRNLPHLSAEDILGGAGGDERSFFHPTEYPDAKSWDDTTSLADLVEQAACVNMTPQELEDELVERSGFGEPVRGWIQEKQMPNGMVRKIILTNAEDILRERGAKPKMTLREVEEV